MGITSLTKGKNLEKQLKAKIENSEQMVIKKLIALGKEASVHAKQFGTYTDRTGNLRSSVGYSVYNNGVEVAFDGSEGTRKLANMVKHEYMKGLVLVLYAGMGYAAYVEALDNYNVLTNTELWVKSKLPEILKQLKR